MSCSVIDYKEILPQDQGDSEASAALRVIIIHVFVIKHLLGTAMEISGH